MAGETRGQRPWSLCNKSPWSHRNKGNLSDHEHGGTMPVSRLGQRGTRPQAQGHTSRGSRAPGASTALGIVRALQGQSSVGKCCCPGFRPDSAPHHTPASVPEGWSPTCGEGATRPPPTLPGRCLRDRPLCPAPDCPLCNQIKVTLLGQKVNSSWMGIGLARATHVVGNQTGGPGVPLWLSGDESD